MVLNENAQDWYSLPFVFERIVGVIALRDEDLVHTRIEGSADAEAGAELERRLLGSHIETGKEQC